MSGAAVVIDTNVVVAGLLSADPDSPVVRILDGMLDAAFAFVVSPALLAEYRAVLLRPHICARHRLAAHEIDTLLTDLAEHAMIITAPPSPQPAPDPKDQMLWDLLATHSDLVLITGDARLLEASDAPGPVWTPAQWMAEN